MASPGWGLPAGISAGVFLAHGLFINEFPVWPIAAGLLVYSVIKRDAWVAAGLISLIWATWCLHVNLADRLEPTLAGSNQFIEGWIEGLPEEQEDFTRFRFKPAANQGVTPLPRTVLTYWYRDPPVLLPGEVWRLELQLKPPWSRINFQGPDRELWLFSEGIGAQAIVRSGERLVAGSNILSNWHALRHAIRLHLNQVLEGDSNRGVVAALAIADRSALTAQHREILSRTGTSHLLAISGLHIGLAAVFGLWLARLLVMAVPLQRARGWAHAATLLASLTLATGYAAVAGFGTSTVRALVMLAVGILALLTRRAIHPAQAILTALALILVFDPLAVLSAGFWLSFIAVGVLLLMFIRPGSQIQSWWRQLLYAQAGIMLVLLPLSAWWFQSASVSGLFANLLAIPYVSFIVVPLILLGLVVLPVSESVSTLAFSAAGDAAGLLLKVLGFLAKLPASSIALSQASLWVVAFAMLGALLLLLPRGLRQRWLGVLLILPVFISDSTPEQRQIRIDILDVGQGTSVLVNSSKHLLLYDSGPGDGADFDLVDTVIRPAILSSGHKSPDRILISHGDLDHAGGLRRLRERYPDAVVYANLPLPAEDVSWCDTTLHWSWDGIDFQVLHPSPYLPYIGNDSSCVLSVRTEQASILLPGDISRAAEQRLLLNHISAHDVLLVPHHGSNTSSHAEFLHFIKPAYAIATAGLGNRFDFPRQEVQKRYADAGIPLWSTGTCGAVRLVLSADGGIQGYSARRLRPAPWRWPVGEDCP